MTWTRIKKQLKGIKEPFIYLYEERLWFIATTLDNLDATKINNMVKAKYNEKLDKKLEEK